MKLLNRLKLNKGEVFRHSAVAGKVLRNRVCPSFLPSFRLSGGFLGIVSLVFSKFWLGARNPYKVGHDRAGFPEIFFLPPKLAKNGPKTGFFKFTETVSH